MRRRSLCPALLATSSGMASLSACATAATTRDAGTAPARLVLLIEVEKVEDMPFHPASDCPEGRQCVQMAYWFKYRARVREVVSGRWAPSTGEFLHLQDASYIDEVTRDCYVVLRPSGPKLRASLTLAWVAVEFASQRFGDGGARIKALRAGQ